MMKFKHLFDNRDLAHMLLAYWDHDRDKLDVMNHFRISANAVYPFAGENGVHYLRFAPNSEKCKMHIQAELDFLQYLNKNGYAATKPVPSKSGLLLVEAPTPWGTYYAAAFEAAPGKQITALPYSGELFYGYGQALARLHLLSQEYAPADEYRRPDWRGRMDWIDHTLSQYPANPAALKEAILLRRFFETLPVTTSNYGLVHYDFELDNVFYDPQTRQYTPIDFDDSFYSWFLVDIEQAVDSIQDELDPETAPNAIDHFLAGYRSIKDIDETLHPYWHILRRSASLFAYVRVLRSAHQRWKNEPEWMIGLRAKLDNLIEQRSACWGTPLL